MCVEATVDGTTYDLAGPLAAVMPAGLVPDARYVETQGDGHAIDMGACLCQIDLPATARRNGYEAWTDEARPGDVWFERPGIEEEVAHD